MPISTIKYEKLKEKYKHFASWTVWDEPPVNSKKNGNISSFDWMIDEKKLLKCLNSKYVFVALNGSDAESLTKNHVWGNFHSTNPRQADYKLRYATANTPAEGSYITDLFKIVPSKNDDGTPIDRTKSSEVLKYLNKHPEKVEENIKSFKAEVAIISRNPILIALGNDAYRYLRKYVYSIYVIEKIPHHAASVRLDGCKGDYRDILNKVLKKYEGR